MANDSDGSEAHLKKNGMNFIKIALSLLVSVAVVCGSGIGAANGGGAGATRLFAAARAGGASA